MGFNRFSLNIIIRVILITANCFFLIHEYIKREYLITIINLSILLIFQTYILIRYINRINLQISEYFDLIRNRESGFRLRNTENKNSFSRLRKQFNETNQIIQDIRIEKEIQTNYLNYIVNYIRIGLLSFDQNQRVQFINPEARKVLGKDEIYKVEDLNSLNENFAYKLRTLQPGNSEIIEINDQNTTKRLSITCGLIHLRQSKIKLISLQDIDNHLYQTELESWNKLIRILNHEIMNSVTPITSLSKTIKKYFYDGEEIKSSEEIDTKYIHKTIEGLDIVEERGKGLINFVNNYRKLTSLPQPNKSHVSVKKLFFQTKNLFIDQAENKNIEFIIDIIPHDLKIYADKDQLMQILINLIKNSINALEEQKMPKITLKASKLKDAIKICIQDNGKGIPQEIIQDIFIPFYTTSESGSGIGLSLSKQIMKAHNGAISVSSVLNKVTEFTLSFYLN